MSELYGYPVLFKMETNKINPSVIKLLPGDVIKKYKTLPFYREGNIVRVLTTDPANEIALEQLKFFLSGFKIIFYIGKDSDFKNLINQFFGERRNRVFY